MKFSEKKPAPIIGISSSIITIESGSFFGRERTFVGYDYVQAIKAAGGIPLVLPFVEESAHIKSQMELVDGLMLSGGHDVSPFEYGEEPEKGLEAVRRERDVYETALVHQAYAEGKPILGICRGQQLLNTVFGGTLFQDIQNSVPHAIQHTQKSKPEDVSHHVDIMKGSKLHLIFGEPILATNSFHHQAIKQLAPGFSATAHARDGIIEGIEKNDSIYVLGVQWHPELMFNRHPIMLKLFKSFVEAAAVRSQHG